MMPEENVFTFIGKAAGIFGCRGCMPEEITDIEEAAAELLERFDEADTNNDGRRRQYIVKELEDVIYAG